MAYQAAPYFRRANYYETDQMGIIHHSNYIRWFEEARLDYMRQAGLGYKEMEARGILMPVTEVSCKFILSIHFEEETEIRVNLVFFNGVRASFRYGVYALNSGKLAVSGESSHCFVDEKTRTPLHLKKRYPDFYEKGRCLLQEEQNTNAGKE